MTGRLRLRSAGTLAMVLVVALYALLSVKRSQLKPLWFDELGTMNVVSQPTLAGMFRVEPADGNPPLQYLLIRPCVHLFGATPFALRLPAMCLVGCMLLCAYLFVGRRYGSLAGLVTATMLLFSRLAEYGAEARPYGLLMGLTALLLLLYQLAAERRSGRTGVLVALAAACFALVLASPLGVFWAAIPLGCAEAYRTFRSRQLDKPLLLAGLAGLSGFVITAFFGRETQLMLSADAGHNHSSVALPTGYKFFESLQTQGMRPALLLVVLLLMTAAILRRMRTPPPGASMTSSVGQDWVAAGALALAIVPVFLFTCVVTHYFWGRYLITGSLGFFLLAGMLCGAIGKRPVTWAALLLGVFLVLFERHQMVVVNASPQTAGAQDSVVPSTLHAGDRSLPIVIAKPFFYPEIWWYSDPALRARLHYIADAPEAVRTSDFVPELTLLSMHRAGSALFPPDGLQAFLAANKNFLLWHHTVVQGCWLEDYLHAHGYSFAPVASDSSGNEVLYAVRAPAAGL